jgi:hypothetical protein
VAHNCSACSESTDDQRQADTGIDSRRRELIDIVRLHCQTPLVTRARALPDRWKIMMWPKPI